MPLLIILVRNMYTLFIDDERHPTPGLTKVLWAKDCDDVSRILNEHGCPAVISFDHDLGQFADGRIKPNAMAALHELIGRHLDDDLDLNNVRRVIVHTQNPSGMRNLQGLWDGFSAAELQSGVKAEILPRTSITE